MHNNLFLALKAFIKCGGPSEVNIRLPMTAHISIFGRYNMTMRIYSSKWGFWKQVFYARCLKLEHCHPSDYIRHVFQYVKNSNMYFLTYKMNKKNCYDMDLATHKAQSMSQEDSRDYLFCKIFSRTFNLSRITQSSTDSKHLISMLNSFVAFLLFRFTLFFL